MKETDFKYDDQDSSSHSERNIRNPLAAEHEVRRFADPGIVLSTAEWIQKQDSYIYCLQGMHFRSKDTHRIKVKG